MQKTAFGMMLSALFIFTPIALAHDEHQGDDYTAAFAAAHHTDTIEISECWIRNIPKPAPSAGYFVVKNNGKDAVSLIAAASTQYGHLMLHQTVDEDGMSKMKMADHIQIKAGESLHFKPGGYHAMLEDAHSPVHEGEQVEVELLFSNHTKVSAQCNVQAPTARAYQH